MNNVSMSRLASGPLLSLFTFLGFYLLFPVTFLTAAVLALGASHFLILLKIIFASAAAVILIFTLFFQSFNIRLRNMIAALHSGKNPDRQEMENISRILPMLSFFLYLIGGIIISVITSIAGFKFDIIISTLQSVSILLVGILLAIISGSLFFFSIRTQFYTLRDLIYYKPLTLFQKLAIPLISVMMVLLLLGASFFYGTRYKSAEESYHKLIADEVDEYSDYVIGNMLKTTLHQLISISQSSDISNMDPVKMQSYLSQLHQTKNDEIELFFASDKKGLTSYDSMGKIGNISQRDYFKDVIKTGKPVISKPLFDQNTNAYVVVIAVPVMSGKTIVGVSGAALYFNKFIELLSGQKTFSSGRFFIISPDGTILHHSNSDDVGKVVGKDITSNNSDDVGVERILTAPNQQFFEYLSDSVRTLSYKKKIPLLENYLVYSCDSSELIEALDKLIINMIITLIVISNVLILVIWFIARRFSVPIQQTIKVIQQLSDGDLSVSITNSLADEFGEMIYNFGQFNEKLRNIVSSSLHAADQLASSSEELASTSQSLSQNAQEEAAAIEEMHASGGQVRALSDSVYKSAEEQQMHVSDMFDAIQNVLKDYETVTHYVANALESARLSTDQAKIGSEMMKNSIVGMRKIDESTKKISEMVFTISEISDQVNMLALNASIEAARAGDHGKGFAVVAEEISNLADGTARSAKEIATLVSQGLNEVTLGVNYVDSTSEALTKITDYIHQTEGEVRHITDSTTKQSDSVKHLLENAENVLSMAKSIVNSTNDQLVAHDEVGKTIEQVSHMSQSSAAASEEIASATEEISAQAESLQAQMHFFKV